MSLHLMIPAELANALRALVDEAIGEMTYTVRDREMKGWEGPRVKRFSDAVGVVELYAAPKVVDPQAAEREQRIAELSAESEQIQAQLRELRGES